jgi:hypothetical protein
MKINDFADAVKTNPIKPNFNTKNLASNQKCKFLTTFYPVFLPQKGYFPTSPSVHFYPHPPHFSAQYYIPQFTLITHLYTPAEHLETALDRSNFHL